MANITENTSLSYTGRDSVDIRRELVSLIPTFTDDWKDFNQSDLGMTIVELIAAAQDFQNFYLDAQAFETYLDTAQQDKNIRSLLRAMNYRVPFMGSAKGTITLSFQNKIPLRGFMIPKYTKLLCRDRDIGYEVCYLTKDAVNLGEDSTVVVTDPESGKVSHVVSGIEVMEGVERTFTVTSKSLRNNTTLSGEVSRRIYLSGGDSSKYADGSVYITSYRPEDNEDLVIWKEVDDAILEYSGGTVFSVHQDSRGQVYLLMSVNFVDYLPTDPTREITIHWVQSLGSKGSIPKGYITGFATFKDWNGNTIGVSSSETSGAYDVPDLTSLKALARGQARTLGRYITLEDYKNGVDTEPFVFKSVVKDWKSPAYVGSPYIVKIWAINHEFQNLNSVDVKTLKKKFYDKGVTDIEVQYVPTNFVKIRMDIRLILKVSSVDNQNSLKDMVFEFISEKYNSLNLDYGYTLSLALLDSGIRALSSYIRGTSITLYTGETEKLFNTKYDVSSIDNDETMSLEDKVSKVKEVIETSNDVVLEVSEDIQDLSEINVITWKEAGDVVLDAIDFPDIYQVSIISDVEGEE